MRETGNFFQGVRGGGVESIVGKGGGYTNHQES